MGEFDLASASWRKSCTDARSIAEALATRMEKALPGLVQIERNFSIFAKNRTVRKITVRFDAQHFFLNCDNNFGLQTEVGNVTNQICLSRQKCDFKQWMTQLSNAIEEHMQASMCDRKAVEDFLLN